MTEQEIMKKEEKIEMQEKQDKDPSFASLILIIPANRFHSQMTQEVKTVCLDHEYHCSYETRQRVFFDCLSNKMEKEIIEAEKIADKKAMSEEK